MQVKIIYGEVGQGSVQVVEYESKYFIRYDAGAHQVVWREDEISKEEAESISQNEVMAEQVLVSLQNRLLVAGINPYISNWKPEASST
jgi:hypothetical protein